MPLVSLAENGVHYWYDPAEQETLDLLRSVCADSMRLLEQTWGLPLPRRCRVYVMTHWSHLTLHAAPWPLRIVYMLLLPLWLRKVRKVWDLAAGLTMRYRGRPAVGVNPMRLWDMRENSMGRRLFNKLGEETLRLRNVVCHELTHAYTAHLQFPLWLNEGLAMLTVDHFLQRETVRRSTLQLLQTSPRALPPGDYAQLAQMQEDAIVYAYAHGYWVTRYLFETRPSILQRLLAKRRSPKAIENELASSLGLSPKTVWQEINTLALAHFAPLETT